MTLSRKLKVIQVDLVSSKKKLWRAVHVDSATRVLSAKKIVIKTKSELTTQKTRQYSKL